MLAVTGPRSVAEADELLVEFLDALAGSGKPAPMPGPDEWEGFLAAASKHKVLPLILAACGDSVPGEERLKHVARLDVLTRASRLQHRAAMRLSLAFEAAGIEFVILKGMAYQELLYSEATIRPCFDIDFLLRNPDMARRAHDLLLSEGFVPGQKWDASKGDFERLSGFHLKYRDGHEYLEYYRKQGDIAEIVELGIKVHTLSPRFTEGVLSRRRRLETNGTEIPVCAPEDMLLCMIENIFEDNATGYAILFGSARLRDFYDLRVFLDRFSETLDWPLFLSILREENAAHKACFVFRRLGHWFLPRKDDPAAFLADACEAAYRLARMRNEQGAFWDVPGLIPMGYGYGDWLKSILDEYRRFQAGMACHPKPVPEVSETVRIGEREYRLSARPVGGEIRLSVRSDSEIPESLVFSVNWILPGAEEPMASCYLKRSGGCAVSHDLYDSSFHSTGRLSRIDKGGWNGQPRPSDSRHLEASARYSGAGADSQGIRLFIHGFFVHERIVADVYHHLHGDDLDFLFLSRLTCLQGDES